MIMDVFFQIVFQLRFCVVPSWTSLGTLICLKSFLVSSVPMSILSLIISFAQDRQTPLLLYIIFQKHSPSQDPVKLSLFTWSLELYHMIISDTSVPRVRGGNPSEAAHGKWISWHMNTIEDQYRQNRAPMSFLFKMNVVIVMTSLFNWKDVKIIHFCCSLLIFKAASQN